MKNILVTNDDGFQARGIQTLTEALSEVGNVYVVAPATEQSACGHGITMHTPMVVKQVEVPFAKGAWSVSGKPADCVKLGVRELVPDVALVVSGTNHGSNVAEDCFYSGTVAGAAEGVFCGLPSMAVSVCSLPPSHFEPSMKIAKKLAEKLLTEGLAEGVMLNVNLPDLPEEEIQGVRVTRLGRVCYNENFRSGESSFGDRYFWYNGEPVRLPQHPDSDIQAIRDGYVTVTPLQFDLTAREQQQVLKGWNLTL